MSQAGNNMEIEKRLDNIEQILERFEASFFGDKYNGNNGYMQRQDNIEKRVEKLERHHAAQLWFFLGAGGLGGAGIVKLFEHFLK
jgi:tetrahydromethanopterin S-methyltransferase subunit G